jgi:poly-beta-1,6-N-acetyl-D-glucosamine synthase
VVRTRKEFTKFAMIDKYVMNKKIAVTIGIAAYNEEQNIQKLLQSIFSQRRSSFLISEILVVSSGSTDKTNTIVKKLAKKYHKIKLFKQTKRLGKASAVNIIISQAKEDIIILCSADILLANETLEKLVQPFKIKNVGIVGSHPIPLNNPKTFFGYAAHMLWSLHHFISLESPKMGECIAFRKVFRQIPVLSAVDEVNIESLIKGQGYKALYAPKAIIYNMGAESLSEFIARRRHIYAGHLVTLYEYGYRVSTISSPRILFLLIKHFTFSWRYLCFTPIIVILEAYGRWLGYLDYKFGFKTHTIWQRTETTKKLPAIWK